MKIDYVLTRSKRKTIAIYIRNGIIDVRVPLRMPKRDIDQFVSSKEKWIISKLKECKEREVQCNRFILDYGDTVLYRGKQYPIVAKKGNCVGFDEERFYMPSNLTSEQIKSACIQIYRILAKRVLAEKTWAFAKQMSVMPYAIKINGAKTHWGSCSAKKSLNFSWRLMMAEDDVIDYVVVHELAHIMEMNHSERFWLIVKNVLPNYHVCKTKLKALQKKLSGEDWE